MNNIVDDDERVNKNNTTTILKKENEPNPLGLTTTMVSSPIEGEFVNGAVTPPIKDGEQQQQQQQQPLTKVESFNNTNTTTTTTQPIKKVVTESKSTKFTCKITNFSQKTSQFYTENYTLWNLTWRLYIFPKGNNSDKDMSIYLDLSEIKQNNVPSIKTSFTVEIMNQKNPEKKVRKTADHTFDSRSGDWGFEKFIEIATLNDPEQGFIVNDTLIINVEIPYVYSISGGIATYDSKKVTGFVGLQNQGATCYMNSLLQALYHISPFRQAVYELPTSSEEPTKSIPLALQRLFFKLQFGDKAVATKELTKSFGWDTLDIFTQHDVQELNRVLCDNLNDKMKGTKAEGTIDHLFRGKIKNFIKCEKVTYESKSDEYFYDLSLNVKGCKDIIHSFDKYTEIERLDGSNQYFAEGFGLQNANKGSKFLSFPPVLHLHLKRFEYDPVKDENVKINDKYKFPEILDLSRYLDVDADKSVSNVYILQGVLVHSGDLHNGHYYTFLKNIDGEWLKFDDDEVTKSNFERVSENSFGSDFGVRTSTRDTNAYMLVYFRETEYERLHKPILESDIQPHLRSRIEKEENSANEQNFNIRLTVDEDFSNHKAFDLLEDDKFPIKTFKKSADVMTIGHLKKQITSLLGIPQERQRLWSWTMRRNKTIRIEKYPESDENTLQSIKAKMPMQGDIRLHLEIAYAPRTVPTTDNALLFPPMPRDRDSYALVFFKFYDPETKTLSFMGSKVIDINAKASYYIPHLNQLVKLHPTTHLLLFEEVAPTKINPIRPCDTFNRLEIVSGDIIVFQKLVSSPNNYSLPFATDYYNYILNNTIVKFKQIDNSSVQFSLELSKQMKYSEITAKIAATIKANPENIRLMCNSRFETPISPIKPNDNIPLFDMLTSANRITNQLHFEILNIPVKECEFKRNFKINWKPSSFGLNHNENEIVSVWVHKLGNENEIIQEFLNSIKNDSRYQTQSGITDATTENNENNNENNVNSNNNNNNSLENINENNIRIVEIRGCKISRILKEDSISTLGESSILRAEPVQSDEIELKDNEKIVQVVHFSRDYGYNMYHGTPFSFLYKPDETTQSLRSRIYEKLSPSGLSQKEFSRWKIAIIRYEKADYLQEDGTISTIDWSSNHFIGLEHPNVNKSHHQQKAIKILG
ncbi:hypothetical protein CYY_005870 [Polysphondylium violaceum]|uniref:ubiquitinyl hydrolase 1 n=1 Tax=Polysphondylium violaceum TaxID=133409 RepID=A0A8J4V3R2_9MYCE|nr:hypothetical protein CYY_005870 [Polysphondylium violaceum]